MKFPLATLYNWYRKLVRNPQTRWWVILGTIVYLISPLDFSPDIFPFAGQIDDVLLLTLLFSELFQLAVLGSDEPEPAQRTTPTSPKPSEPEDTIDVQSVTIED